MADDDRILTATDLPRVLGSNMERDRAVEQLGRELDRQRPPSAVDFWAMIPKGADKLPSRSQWELEREMEEREKRLRDSGIANALTDEDLDWLIRDALPLETESMFHVRNWDERRAKMRSNAFSVLVLLGLKGQGKSVSGGWLIGKHGPGVYCTSEDLRASFVATHHRDRELIRRALTTRVLHIDELGREQDSRTADAMLFNVINARRGRSGHDQLWSLLTGNIDDAVFRGRYDGSTVDRIEQQGAIFTVNTENLRTPLVERLKRGAQP